MIRFLTLRLLLTAASLWLILTMVFFLIHLVPGDPVEQMLGEGARAEDLAALRSALGLDKPVAAQYADYLGGVIRGDFGQSFRFQRAVLSVVLE
ncbi:MAG: ABC transporter permease, partial [Candidatus Acidiferrales bacterium]